MKIPLLDYFISLESGKSIRARDGKKKNTSAVAAALLNKILYENLQLRHRLKRYEG